MCVYFGGGGAMSLVEKLIYNDYTGVNTTRNYKTLEDKAALPWRLNQNQDLNSSYSYT